MGSIYSLVRSAQNGNDKAKQQLYKDTVNKAYYIAYVLLGDEEAVKKTLSAVYLNMYAEIGDIDKPKQFNVWFSKLLLHEMSRIYRGMNAEAFASTEREEESLKDCPTLRLDTYDETDIAAPEDFYDIKQVKDILSELHGACSNEQLVCGVLYYYMGLSVVDIAEGLGCSVSIVKMKLAHLVEQVQTGILRLQEKEYDTYDMKPMDLYACLLDVSINQVWYISQEMSNNIMTNILTAINRGTEDTTIELKNTDAFPAAQHMQAAPVATEDDQPKTVEIKKKGFFSGIAQGIIAGIVIGIIILVIIIMVLKLRADDGADASDKGSARDTEAVTTEEATDTDADEESDKGIDEQIDDADIDASDDAEEADEPENDKQDDKDEKKENDKTDDGISGGTM